MGENQSVPVKDETDSSSFPPPYSATATSPQEAPLPPCTDPRCAKPTPSTIDADLIAAFQTLLTSTTDPNPRAQILALLDPLIQRREQTLSTETELANLKEALQVAQETKKEYYAELDTLVEVGNDAEVIEWAGIDGRWKIMLLINQVDGCMIGTRSRMFTLWGAPHASPGL